MRASGSRGARRRRTLRRRLPVLLLAVVALVGAGLGRVRIFPPPSCPLSTAQLEASAGSGRDAGSTVAPKGPVGWDTFRQLDDLPLLTVGEQPQLSSSADPRGGNADGFAGTYLCRADDGYVLALDAGPGELTSLWFTRADGDVRANGRIRIELDGRTVVDDELQDVVDGRLGAPFVAPLVGNADQTSGGASIQVPMPYERSMRVVLDTVPRFYRVQYRTFADRAGVTTFDPTDPATDVVERLRAAGQRAPTSAAGSRGEQRAGSVPPGGALPAVRLQGPGAIAMLRVQLPASAGAEPGVRLRMRFDGQDTVDAPVGEFFGAGLGTGRVATLMYAADGEGTYRAWWPMPFAETAEAWLVNETGRTLSDARLEVRWDADDRWTEELGPGGRAGHFHATAREGPTTLGRDWGLVRLAGHGRVVGLSQTMVGRQSGRTYLEGDERVRIDHARSPSLQGTGTEDLYLAGWYFNRGPFTTAFSGLSAHETGTDACPHHCDAAHRVLVADALAFHGTLDLGIEHGVANTFPADYASTTFWYGRAEPALVRTDELDVGDLASEAAHDYVDTATPATLRSTYPEPEIADPVTDVLASTRGLVSLRLRLDPDNAGAILRRRADQRHRGQAARVWVDGVPIGPWLRPDGNATHRWADDDVVLPAAVTRGRAQVEVRLQPLPGAPPWTAARYEVFSLRPESSM